MAVDSGRGEFKANARDVDDDIYSRKQRRTAVETKQVIEI